MIGDLTGESLILKLLRKILQLEASFNLIEDTEDSFKGVILIVGSKGSANILRNPYRRRPHCPSVRREPFSKIFSRTT